MKTIPNFKLSLSLRAVKAQNKLECTKKHIQVNASILH